MSRNIRSDKSVLENTLCLVEALLRHADGEYKDEELEAVVYVEWVTENKLRVTGKKVEQISGQRSRTVEVGTKKEHLLKLLEKAGKSLKPPQRKKESGSGQKERQLEEVQYVLDSLRKLELLKEDNDNNIKKTRGYWKFTLMLEHQTEREKNLELVKQKWKEHSKTNSPEVPPTASTIDRNVRDITEQFQKIVKDLNDIKYDINLAKVLQSIQNASYGSNTKEKAQENVIAFLNFVSSLTNLDELKNKLNELKYCYLDKFELNNELVQDIFTDCNLSDLKFTLYKILQKNLDVFLIKEVDAAIDLYIVKNTFDLKYPTFIWNITDRSLEVEDILRPLLSRDIVSVHFSEFTNENFYSYTDFGKKLRQYIIDRGFSMIDP